MVPDGAPSAGRPDSRTPLWPRSGWAEGRLLEWLGIEKGSDFDPAHFDTADANRRLDAVILAATRTA